MRGADGGAVADGLRGVLVGGLGGVVRAVDLGINLELEGTVWGFNVVLLWGWLTPSIACFTRGEWISPFFDKFSISASFEAPDDLHAMLMLLRAVDDTVLPILGRKVKGEVWR